MQATDNDNELSPLPLDSFAGCWFRRQFGPVTVTALCDGHMPIAIAAFPNGNEEKAIALARANGLDPANLAVSVSAFCLQTEGRTWLIDAGTGNVRGPNVGHLPRALQRAGFGPEQIDTVVLTHMHVDHAAGLFLDDDAVFPNAEVWVSQPELDFWTGDAGAFNELQLTQLPFNEKALRLYEGRIRTFAPGHRFGRHIQTVPLPGHTPGMTGFLVGGDTGRVLIWADVVHMAAFQGPHPDWSIRFDVDPALAAKTRIAAFERAIAEGLKVTGAHVPFPGFATIERVGDAYAYRPQTSRGVLEQIVSDGGADSA